MGFNEFASNLSSSCSKQSAARLPRPLHSSTPLRSSQQNKWEDRPLRLLNITLQSVEGKKTEISNLLDCAQPGIITATGTWLHPTLSSAEILPNNCKVYRKDRNRHEGVVMLATKTSLYSQEVTAFQVDCELIWDKIKVRGRATLFVCTYYRPNISDGFS